MEEPAAKKRKLFDEASPREYDSPEFHQGRTRTTPHVDGVWPAHIFIELTPTRSLRKALKSSIVTASNGTRDVHSFLSPIPSSSASSSAVDSDAASALPPLHLSLSRPLLLLAGQRPAFRSAVAGIATKFSGFEASFATFAILENDELTRRFLGIEIGSGYSQIKSLTDAIDEQLALLRLPPYYSAPRFHSSIAWTSTTSTTLRSGDDPLPFDETALKRIEQKSGDKLRDEVLWVGEISCSIGKEVWHYTLSSL